MNYYDWSYELDRDAKSSRYDNSLLNSTTKYNNVAWGSAPIHSCSMNAIMDAYTEYHNNYNY